jgi:5-methylcytosine-specific restriction endonuclease McrA
MAVLARRRWRVRRPQVRHVSRAAVFGPALAAPLGGWLYLREPPDVTWPHAAWWHLAGLAVFILAGLMTWPLLVLSVLFLAPEAVRGGLFPRRFRARYRQKHGRQYIGRDGRVHEADSSKISARLRRIVFFADRYRCSACKARAGDWRRDPDGREVRVTHMEIDHFIPWIGGGSTSLQNCFTLCNVCNNVKSCYQKAHDGYEYYNRARRSAKNLAQARWITHRERIHRFNLSRWLRAAWAIAQ